MPSFNPGMESCASVLLAARKPCPSSFCGPALSTAFHKWLPQLWASSLDGELLPCRRCVIPATGGNASASPQCWRMQAALLHPQRCFVGLSDFYILQMAATKSSKLSMTPKSGEEFCWSHISGDKTIPISCLWDAAFSQADYIWIFPQNYPLLVTWFDARSHYVQKYSWIGVCGVFPAKSVFVGHTKWVLSSFPAHPSFAGDAFYREYHSAAVLNLTSLCCFFAKNKVNLFVCILSSAFKSWVYFIRKPKDLGRVRFYPKIAEIFKAQLWKQL